MIDQSLINHIEAVIEDSQGSAVDISTGKLTELLDSYKSLIEQNADIHKELARFKAQSFDFNFGVKCSNTPNNLAM